jgi:hypothetical protein
MPSWAIPCRWAKPRNFRESIVVVLKEQRRWLCFEEEDGYGEDKVSRQLSVQSSGSGAAGKLYQGREGNGPINGKHR